MDLSRNACILASEGTFSHPCALCGSPSIQYFSVLYQRCPRFDIHSVYEDEAIDGRKPKNLLC